MFKSRQTPHVEADCDQMCHGLLSHCACLMFDVCCITHWVTGFKTVWPEMDGVPTRSSSINFVHRQNGWLIKIHSTFYWGKRERKRNWNDNPKCREPHRYVHKKKFWQIPVSLLCANHFQSTLCVRLSKTTVKWFSNTYQCSGAGSSVTTVTFVALWLL